MEKDKENNAKSSIFLKAGAIIIVIVLLLVISLAIVKVVPKAISSLASANLSFSSLFAPKASLTASLSPGLIKSGDEATINFSKTGTNTAGYYTISYSCQSGAKLNYLSGSTSAAMNCAAPYPFSPSGNSITITGFAPSNSTLTAVPISLAFIPNGASTSTLSTSLSLTISNTGKSATSSTPATSVTISPSTAPSSSGTANTYTNTGAANLSVSLIDEGIIDPTSGQFISTRNFNAGNVVVVKFQIKNNGTAASGPWSFSTAEPMVNSADLYRNSGTLGSLLPSYSTGVITLTLSGLNQNGGNVTITTKPQNKTLSVSIPAENYNYNYNNNYSSGNYYYGNNTDLAVKVISVTDLNQYNNQYYYNYSPNSFRAGDTIQAVVEVYNVGTNPTGPYTLTANLNGVNQTFNNLQSIAPNNSTNMTVTFTNVSAQGTGSLTITAQTQDHYDNNQSNNTSSVAVSIY